MKHQTENTGKVAQEDEKTYFCFHPSLQNVLSICVFQVTYINITWFLSQKASFICPERRSSGFLFSIISPNITIG